MSPTLTSTLDPLAVLKAFGSLRRLAGTYPAGHPMTTQKLKELDELVRQHLQPGGTVRIDVIQGDVFLDAEPFQGDTQTAAQILRELSDLGIDSIEIRDGIAIDELYAVAEFLWQLKDRSYREPIETQLAARQVSHVSLGRLVPLDTRWRSQQWPSAPTGPIDAAYQEAINRAEQAWHDVESGKPLDAVTVRDLVQLLIHRVARSNAALGQILAVKQYEDLTYWHSVNVAMLSLLLGKKLSLDESRLAALVEGALLHDIGKTQIPLDILKKPGALDKRERKAMEAHTTYGSEILAQIDGLQPLTPIIALEHHRSVKGSGYPDLGEGAVPHIMSQIVAVADIYEALTGARTYQDPSLPEQACLILARLAGEKLNTSFVKAFVNAVTFFPIGSLVRTSRDEKGVVVQTNPLDPLHPVITLVDEKENRPGGQVDLSTRDSSGNYERHIAETLLPTDSNWDVTKFLETAPAAV
jgi:putative nucleotidyltransferase with HDIG domain